MARWAASRSSLGGGKLGIPWARLTPPYWLLTRVISRITDSVNPWTRLEIMEGGVRLLLLEADHHPGDLFLVDPDRDLLRPAGLGGNRRDAAGAGGPGGPDGLLGAGHRALDLLLGDDVLHDQDHTAGPDLGGFLLHRGLHLVHRNRGRDPSPYPPDHFVVGRRGILVDGYGLGVGGGIAELGIADEDRGDQRGRAAPGERDREPRSKRDTQAVGWHGATGRSRPPPQQ